FGGATILTHAARASGGSGPTASCTSTTPCLEEDNTSSGPGLKGTSKKGNGMVGTTKAKGISPATTGSGVVGQDLQTTTGVFNAGVTGTSTNGVGVSGTSTNWTGVNGLSANLLGIGVEGRGAIGVFGNGPIGVAAEDAGGATNDVFFANGAG